MKTSPNNKKLFQVILTRKILERVTIRVRAKDENHAENIARLMDLRGQIAWPPQTPNIEYKTTATEIKEL